MKRILGVSLVFILTFAWAGVAGAQDSDPVYESLIQYFEGEIDLETLEDRLEEIITQPAAFSQAHHQLGDNYTQPTTCGGKPNPMHEAHRRDPWAAFLSSRPYQTVYCYVPTGQWVTGRIAQAGVDYAREDQLIAPGDAEHDDSCIYRNDEGEPRPAYQWDPETQTFTEIHGAHWDPIAQQCRQRYG